jgi:hypothetical protein
MLRHSCLVHLFLSENSVKDKINIRLFLMFKAGPTYFDILRNKDRLGVSTKDLNTSVENEVLIVSHLPRFHGPRSRLDNIGLMVVQAISHYIQSYFSICITSFDRFLKIHFRNYRHTLFDHLFSGGSEPIQAIL